MVQDVASFHSSMHSLYISVGGGGGGGGRGGEWQAPPHSLGRGVA